MAATNTPVPKISEQDAADIFAYFASLRYFEPMGDAGRGARTFEAKRCAGCHAEGATRGAIPISRWHMVTDPIVLVSAMWNHVPQMRERLQKEHMKWPELTGHDLSDIVLYARSFPSLRNEPIRMELPPLDGGDALVETYGCKTCHTGQLDFSKLSRDRTLTDIAAAMWNHGPRMVQQPAEIPSEKMRQLLGSIWVRQFLKPSGDPAKGRKVAETKKCVTCHDHGPGPSFANFKGSFSVLNLTSALWSHGPNMLAQMQQKKITWPRLSAVDVDNLLAYINSPGATGRSAKAGSAGD